MSTENKVKNALKTNKSNQLSRKKDTELKGLVERMSPAIEKALPSVLTPDRFSRIVLTALSSDPNLRKCTPESFCGAMMLAAQLGVEPNTPLGQAYLIPYKNKGKLECQFQLGYKGLIDLAYRSGEITTIQAHTVYENDDFTYSLGLNPVLEHVPYLDGDRGQAIYYYAVWKTKSGGYGFEVMSKHDIQRHANDFSQSYNSNYSPWKKNFDAMAKKTVIKQALKYAPIKTDFVRQLNADETVKVVESPELLAFDNSPDVIDLPNEIEFEVEEESVTVDPKTGEVQETLVN